MQYSRLKQNIQKGKIDQSDLEGISVSIFKSRGMLKQIIDHKRLFKEFILFKTPQLVRDTCCRCLKRKGKGNMLRLIKAGSARFYNELDCVNLMRTVRQSKLLSKTQLT